MLFILDLVNNTILSSFFFSFLIIDLYFLIPAVNRQTFNLIAEHKIPIGIPSEETKSEIETNPVTEVIKITKCSI